MNSYKNFTKIKVDFSCIGLGKGDVEGGYFCTPIGARVIGWEGADGIHYCFIDGLGEMVFVVSPMPCASQYVYPLAEDFKTFIELILATKSATALEQISWVTKEKFNQFLNSEDNATIPEQKEMLNILSKKLELNPHQNPYDYVAELQSKFDYKKLKFSDEFYDITGNDKPN